MFYRAFEKTNYNGAFHNVLVSWCLMMPWALLLMSMDNPAFRKMMLKLEPVHCNVYWKHPSEEQEAEPSAVEPTRFRKLKTSNFPFWQTQSCTMWSGTIRNHQEPGSWDRCSTPVFTLPLCLQDCTAWAMFFQSLTKTMPSQFYSLLTESCFSSCRVQHGLVCQHCGHLPGIKILPSANSLVLQSWSFWTVTVPFKAGSSLRLLNSTIKTRIHL